MFSMLKCPIHSLYSDVLIMGHPSQSTKCKFSKVYCGRHTAVAIADLGWKGCSIQSAKKIHILIGQWFNINDNEIFLHIKSDEKFRNFVLKRAIIENY